MRQQLYTKDDKIYDIRKGVDTGEGTTLYWGTEEQMRELGYEPYTPQEFVETPEMILNNEIEDLKRQLSETDYILFKSLEGYDCDTLYPGWKTTRRNLRDQINAKEEELNNLIN